MTAGQWGQIGFWIALMITIASGIFIGKSKHFPLSKIILLSALTVVCAALIENFLHWIVGFGFEPISFWLERTDVNRWSNIAYEARQSFFFVMLISVTICATRLTMKKFVR